MLWILYRLVGLIRFIHALSFFAAAVAATALCTQSINRIFVNTLAQN